MEHELRVGLEVAFLEIDDQLKFGFSYALLEMILKDLNLLETDSKRTLFLKNSGYHREVQIH